MIASGIGFILALVLARTGAGGDSLETQLPPLTLLFISEFGFLVTVAGAWVGGRTWYLERDKLGLLLAALGCLVLALAFLYIGLGLWGRIATI